MNQTEAAWAAGFFDGEGTANVRLGTKAAKGRGYKNGTQIRVNITQVDREVLDRFQKAVGGVGKIYGPYIRKNTSRKTKPYFFYQAHTYSDVKVVFDVISGFLGTLKRNQLQNVVSFWEESHVGA